MCYRLYYYTREVAQRHRGVFHRLPLYHYLVEGLGSLPLLHRWQGEGCRYYMCDSDVAILDVEVQCGRLFLCRV